MCPRPDHPEPVAGSAFAAWFARSQAVDARGRPLRLYHGTGEDTGNVFRPGTFFSPDPAVAAIYAQAPTRQTAQAGPSVTPVFLSLQRPFVFDDQHGRLSLSRHVLSRRGALEQVIARLAELGYDSLIRKNYLDLGGVQDQYVIFKPEQAKSATGNQGAFSMAQQDVRFSLAQAISQPAAQPRQAQRQGTPAASGAFQRWFGQSLVLDQAGAPLKVYRGEHGPSQAQFHSRGSLTFSANPATASLYAMEPNWHWDTPVAPRVMPVYLRIERPFLLADEPFVELSHIERTLGRQEAIRCAADYDEAIRNTGNWQENFEGRYDSVVQAIAAGHGLDEFYFEVFRMLDRPEEVRRLVAAGYDGAIHEGSGASAMETEYRIFSEHQAKSATGNTGQYSARSQDIRFSLECTPAADPASANIFKRYAHKLPEPPESQMRLKQALARLLGASSQELPMGLGKIVVLSSQDLSPDWQPMSLPGQVEPGAYAALIAAARRHQAQAFYDARTRTTALIADRIPAGSECAVYLHEMVHKHGRAVMGEQAWTRLLGQVKAWAAHAPGTRERTILDAALARALASGTSGPVSDEELFAYAVEHAIGLGVEPSAQAAEHSSERWLAEVIASIERVGQKLAGDQPQALGAQDIADLAYALAQLDTPRHAQAIRRALDQLQASAVPSRPAPSGIMPTPRQSPRPCGIPRCAGPSQDRA